MRFELWQKPLVHWQLCRKHFHAYMWYLDPDWYGRGVGNNVTMPTSHLSNLFALKFAFFNKSSFLFRDLIFVSVRTLLWYPFEGDQTVVGVSPMKSSFKAIGYLVTHNLVSSFHQLWVKEKLPIWGDGMNMTTETCFLARFDGYYVE